MKKITISVGIPAYNEEANIGNLIDSLLKQNQNNFNLKEIIIVSDHSTDNTDSIIKDFKNRKIKLIVNKKRQGQSFGQEKIIKQFDGEILVLLNADIMPSDQLFLNHLVQPIIKNKNVVLTAPKISPTKPKSFFERILYFSNDYKEAMIDDWNSGNNILHCHGRARAFSREFAKTIKWPTAVGEDAFTYFLCITNHHEFRYQPKAEALYQPPTNIKDHQKQSSRYLQSQKIMADIFGENLVLSTYKIPTEITLKNSLIYLFKNPIYFSFYVLIFIYIALTTREKNTNSLWDVSQTSKVLISK